MNRNKCVKRIRKVYSGMRQRCTNPNSSNYKNYGAKGVQVRVKRDEFVDWYIENVTDEMIKPTVDRIDPSGHYEFSNMEIIPASLNSMLMQANLSHKQVERRIRRLNCE